MILRIDKDFKALIPKLSEIEYEQLKENICQDGCRDSLVVWEDKIIDGHNRYKICTENDIEFKTEEKNFKDKEDAKIWIINNQFGRRNISLYQRARLALVLEPLISAKAKENLKTSTGGNNPQPLPKSAKAEKIDTREELAKTAGVSHDTIAKVKVIEELADEKTKEKLSSGDMSINQAYKKTKKEQRKDEIQEERTEIAEKAKDIPEDDRFVVYHGSMQDIELNKKYDFIITDPPYPAKFLSLYESLAIRSKEWLKDGGLLIAMCGQSYLNKIYEMMSSHLEYYWTACYLTPGQPTPLRQINVNTTWKPLLIFHKKEDKYKGKIFGDVFKSDNNDKDFHKWGQSVSGMLDIVSKICLPGQTILDPFCGAGTTGIAAKKHGCLFNGIEIDIENVNISKTRILNDKTNE